MKRVFFIVSFIWPLWCNGQIINTVAGNGTGYYNADGIPAVAAGLEGPKSIAVDGHGNYYFSTDTRIRKVDAAGIIYTVAGNGALGNYGADGIPATDAYLNSCRGIAVDDLGNLYICDFNNNAVRKVDVLGIITTVAGTGVYGYSGDGGPATDAKLWGPTAVYADDGGSLYIADAGNNRIRKVAPDGIITTVAGTGERGYGGDGGHATDAKFYFPAVVVFDHRGRMYIGDVGNRRIRMVNKFGIIKTVAGNGDSKFSGDGGPATAASLVMPYGIAFDAHDNMYFSDVAIDRVRRVTPEGIISTVAGTGEPGYSGDGGPATAARVFTPWGVACDDAGGLYIATQNSERVRYVSNIVGTEDVQISGNGVYIYPNPSKGRFVVRLSQGRQQDMTISVTDVTGRTVAKREGQTDGDVEMTMDVAPGLYVVKCISGDKVSTNRLVVE